jgi:hypothetical protein
MGEGVSTGNASLQRVRVPPRDSGSTILLVKDLSMGFRRLSFQRLLKTLDKIACNRESNVEEETLKVQLEYAFNQLSGYGAVYWDQRLDNFLLCNDEHCNTGKVMVVDLEQVESPSETRPWELQVNRAGARSLMEDFSYIRHPTREDLPVKMTRTGKHDDENALIPTEPISLMP